MATRKPAARTRNTAGEFERDLEQADLDRRAAELRALRMSYPAIAREMGCAVSTAEARVKRALASVPVEAVTELRRLELADLDDQARRWRLMASETHYGRPVVYKGRVIERVVDKQPNIQALRELRLVGESRRRLLGIDAPEQKLLVVKDSIAQEIERLAEELGLTDAEKAQALEGA